ncbi:MAG: alpha/beta hydrolase [Myxococcales bacterium]|nr:alpha/beta hydrolase [Myxococcales bacterium]
MTRVAASATGGRGNRRRRLGTLVQALGLVASLGGCQALLLAESFEGGDFFFLENNGAVMPIWVRGDTSSGTFVVFLHGGPGNSSYSYATAPAYDRLAESYALVFWDQRGSGAAQGDPSPESYTLEQFAKDTKKVVQLIRHKYDVEALFLAGKSWGACVGTAFLLGEGNQEGVSGWIEIDGAHNLKEGIPLSWEWTKAAARARIKRGSEVARWQREIAWYESRPAKIDTDYFLRHGENLNDLDGIYRDPAKDPGNFFPLSAPIPFLYQLNAYFLNQDNRLRLESIDLSDQMGAITVPSMVLWGRHDGTLPVALADDAYDSLGTPEGDKHRFIFENSAHVPAYEEPELFVEKMTDFIEAYR